ncbi:MAG TPA: lysophospholipid acyltransferase family protein [Gaiellaceae bacterium]|nr:lysophospholipid acyltransferase family protein [Gaiellaceae bacterium]
MNAYRLLDRLGLRELLRRAYRVDVVGAERVPASGAAILVANHESIWDPFVLGVVTEREIHYMAKAELFRTRPLAAALRALNAFPVERGGGDRAAISEAARLLESGALLGIFPQGTSKRERQIGWHRGAARLALATGAPVVPVRLTGTRPLPWPTRIRIVVGEPIAVEPERPTISTARALTERLERAVTAA